MSHQGVSTGRLIVGITGASGVLYAFRFLEAAAHHYQTIYIIATDQARQVMAVEMGLPALTSKNLKEMLPPNIAANLHVLHQKDYFCPPASGSFVHDGMVIVPCSMGTAARIAHGLSDDLLTRAADVCLKERRKLILVPRETPLSLVHLRNLTQLAEAGAVVLPASPGFYHRPQSVEEIADFIVARILQQLGVEHKLVPPWQFVEEETGA